MEKESPLVEAVDGFLDHLLVERRYSQHTIDAYRRSQCRGPVLSRNNFDWSELDAALNDAFRSEIARSYSPTSVQRRLSALRSFLKYLVRSGLKLNHLPSASGIRKTEADSKGA